MAEPRPRLPSALPVEQQSGFSLGKARRALRELMAFRPDGCLPASSVLINRLLAHFDEADTNLKRTQGMTVRSDLIILKDLGLPTL